MTAAKRAKPELVTVTVHRYQIGYAGRVVNPGESVDVPADVAERWVATGIATAGK